MSRCVQVEPGTWCLRERGNKGEKKDSESLARQMASLCDVFVMDAFGTAHRAEASTHGVARFAPVACAGPLLVGELTALELALEKPKRPLIAIVAGSKVSSKLTILESLLERVDRLIVGGGIANTFLAATGVNVGKSLCEMESRPRRRLRCARGSGRDILAPMSSWPEFAATAPPRARHPDVRPEEPSSTSVLIRLPPRAAHCDAGTVLWNGPSPFRFEHSGRHALIAKHARQEFYLAWRR